MISTIGIVLLMIMQVIGKENQRCIIHSDRMNDSKIEINETNCIFIISTQEKRFDIDAFLENGTLVQCDLPKQGEITISIEKYSYTISSKENTHIDILMEMNETSFSMQTNGKIPFHSQQTIDELKESIKNELIELGYGKIDYSFFTYLNFLTKNSTISTSYLESIVTFLTGYQPEEKEFKEKQMIIEEYLEKIEKVPFHFSCKTCLFLTDIFGSLIQSIPVWDSSKTCDYSNSFVKETCKLLMLTVSSYSQKKYTVNYSDYCNSWCY